MILWCQKTQKFHYENIVESFLGGVILLSLNMLA